MNFPPMPQQTFIIIKSPPTVIAIKILGCIHHFPLNMYLPCQIKLFFDFKTLDFITAAFFGVGSFAEEAVAEIGVFGWVVDSVLFTDSEVGSHAFVED